METDESVPYIEEPEVKDDHIRNGLMCFLNMDRECGPDCMAYTTFNSESQYLNPQQQRCSLIVSAERLGRYSGGLLSILKKSMQDDARTKATKNTPPDPMGAT